MILKKKVAVVIVVVVILVAMLVVSFFVLRSYEKYVFQSEQVSSKEFDSSNVEIKRDKYYFRNFIWSGIFPFYGGFIPDPHFLFQRPVDITEYLSPIFHGKSVRYQLMQVNPYFEDRSSELILAVEIEGLPYEIKLEYPSDFYSFSTEESRSVFLYNGNTLYFVMPYNFRDELLVYQINYPFNETEEITYSTINLNGSNVSKFFDFRLSQDQIDMLLNHPIHEFYQFYTQYLNKDYAFNQTQLKKIEALHLPTFYGSSLNVNRSNLKGIKDEEFQLRVHNLYEFISFSQDVEVAKIPDSKKIAISAIHKNYYDLLFLGDSFESSHFAVRTEHKSILLEYQYLDRLLRHINRYKELRQEKITDIQNLKERPEDRVPLLIEIITNYNDEYTINRSGMSFYIMPSITSPKTERDFSNRTDYALPDHIKDNEYFFVMDFGDFSLKLSEQEVQKLKIYLQNILLE